MNDTRNVVGSDFHRPKWRVVEISRPEVGLSDIYSAEAAPIRSPMHINERIPVFH